MTRQPDSMNQQDSELLARVDAYLTGAVDALSADSRYGFCARLATAQPQPEVEFASRLSQHCREAFLTRHSSGQQEEQPGHYPAWSRQNTLKEGFQPGWLPKRRVHPGVYVLVSSLVLLLVACATIPQVREPVFQMLQQLILGNFTRAEQIELIETPEPFVTRTPVTCLFDSGVSQYGCGLPGNAHIEEYDTIAAAEDATGLSIDTPVRLPQGYQLLHVIVIPGDFPTIILRYQGPGPDRFIAEQKGGIKPGQDPGSAIGVFYAYATSGSLEKVEVNSSPAAWIDGSMLIWEKDDFCYQVEGQGLTLEDALLIAGSIPQGR